MGSGIAALARLLPDISRPLTAGLVVAALLSAVAAPATTIITGQVFGSLGARVTGEEGGGDFFTFVALLGALMLVTHVLGQLVGLFGGMLARRVNGELRNRVMAACLRPATVDHLHDPEVHPALAMSRDLSPAGFTPGQAASSLAPVLSSRLAALLQAAVLIPLGLWWMALPLVAVRAVFEFGLMSVFFQNIRGMLSAGIDLRRVTYFRDLGTTPPGAKEIRLFGLASWVGERNRTAFQQVMGTAWSGRKSNGRWLAFLGVLRAVGLFFGYGTVTVAALAGNLDLAGFVVGLAAVQGTLNFGGGDNELALAYGATAVPAVVRLENLVSQSKFDPPAGRPADGLPARSVRFEGVRFAYPGTDKPVFDRLDLEIPAGQRLAIVGLNGAGKTTLVKLLCRLHTPDAGRITVDGIDLTEIDPAAWRTRVGVLFQDYLRYQLPARDNVRFGAPDVDVDDAHLDQLAARVGASGVLDRLESGWDTPLSASLKGGTDLSGGQWQRLALARALLAVDAGARILVLDEPTANLDVRAEADIYARFLDLTRGRSDGEPLTSIVISHRFSTVRRADRIVVLDGGHVIEDGTHHELLGLDGRYAALFKAQAMRFRDSDAAAVLDDAPAVAVEGADG